MRAADHVMTIAEAMRDDIIERGVDPDRVTVIPNGVDADRLHAPSRPIRRSSARYGLDGRFTFGYVSNLDHPRENQELLVEATARLLGRGRAVDVPDHRRRPAPRGDRADRKQVRRRQRGSSSPAACRTTRCRSHYALLDAFVVPRRDERAARTVTPLKPYEALAMATPAGRRRPARPHRDRRRRTSAAWPSAGRRRRCPRHSLERLMDDPALARRIGDAGREWVARERTWAANGPRYRDVLRPAVLDRWAVGSGDGRLMDGQPRGPRPGARRLHPRGDRALARPREAPGRADPARATTRWPVTNPYQSLLYQRQLASTGIAAGADRPRRNASRSSTELARRGLPTVLHLHWLNLVLAHARSAEGCPQGLPMRSSTASTATAMPAGGSPGRSTTSCPTAPASRPRRHACSAERRRTRCDVVHVMAAATAEHGAPRGSIPRRRSSTSRT